MAQNFSAAEHDSAKGAKRVNVVAGTITASSQVTVTLGPGNATIYAVVNTAAAGQASVVLDTGTKWVGLATVNLGAAIPAGTSYIGLVSVSGKVENTSTKTLVHKSFGVNASGFATIFVPSNTFNITHLTLSANATVGVRILSGPTYLTGNASLNMTFFPGGGVVENGQLLNPVYKGATSGDAFVLDLDGSVEIAGKVVYYDE